MATLSSTGYTKKTKSQILSELVSSAKTIYGNDADFSPSSIDGMMLGLFTGVYSSLEDLGEAVVNGYTPNTALGVQLDHIAGLNGITRKAGTKGTVTLTFTGTAGTVIPAGTIAGVSATLEKFKTLSSATIPAGQTTVAVSSEATTEGTAALSIGAIGTMITPVFGITAVTNLAQSTAGSLRETDAELRSRRLKSFAISGQATVDSIFSGVGNISGVTSVSVYDNPTSSTDSLGHVAYSINVYAQGGDNSAIGKEIWTRKPAGIRTEGNTSVNVTDSQGNTQTVKFSRPTLKTVYITMQLSTTPPFPANGVSLIQTAIVNYFATLKIGDDVFWSKIVDIAINVPGHSITSIFLGFSPSPTTQQNLTIAHSELATITASNIVINI